MTRRRLSLVWVPALALLLSGCGGGGAGALIQLASYIPPIVGDWVDVNDPACEFNFIPSGGGQPLFEFTGTFTVPTNDPLDPFQGAYNERQVTLTAPSVDVNICGGIPAGTVLNGAFLGVDQIVFDNFTLTKAFNDPDSPDFTTGVWVNQADSSHTFVFTQNGQFGGCEVLGGSEGTVVDIVSVDGTFEKRFTLTVQRNGNLVAFDGEFVGVSTIDLSALGAPTITLQRANMQGSCSSNP